MTGAELLVVAAMLAPGAERTPGAADVVQAVALAVQDARARVFDDDPTGDTDAVVQLVYAWRESGFRADAVGDGGKSLGMWQLRYTPAAFALDPLRAAIVWRRLAFAGKRRWPDCPLRGVSGGGSAGERVAAQRVQLARQLVGRLRASRSSTRAEGPKPPPASTPVLRAATTRARAARPAPHAGKGRGRAWVRS